MEHNFFISKFRGHDVDLRGMKILVEVDLRGTKTFMTKIRGMKFCTEKIRGRKKLSTPEKNAPGG